jgi:hypothetical protein
VTEESDRAALAGDLARLPDEALLDVLRRLFAQRRPNPEEDSYCRNRFFLGTASQMLDDDGVNWGPWQLETVAYPDLTVYGGGLGPDWGFCQSGQCQACGTEVRSNVKQGICPICESDVYMT